MNLYPEFEGKVVVMTGVSSGIGLEQAKAFLQAGAIVYGADIKESAEIKEVEQKFPTLSFQQVDIRKKKDIHMWTEKIKKRIINCGYFIKYSCGLGTSGICFRAEGIIRETTYNFISASPLESRNSIIGNVFRI